MYHYSNYQPYISFDKILYSATLTQLTKTFVVINPCYNTWYTKDSKLHLDVFFVL